MSGGILREGELEFDFTESGRAEKFDEEGKPAPEGWKRCDFVVEEPTRTLLIEVKDPMHSKALEGEAERYGGRLMSNGELLKDLVRKCRDSYCHLHLMERDAAEFAYYVLLALPDGADPSLLTVLKDKLAGKIRQETDEPWKRQYVKPEGVLVFNLEQWNKNLDYKATRTRR